MFRGLCRHGAELLASGRRPLGIDGPVPTIVIYKMISRLAASHPCPRFLDGPCRGGKGDLEECMWGSAEASVGGEDAAPGRPSGGGKDIALEGQIPGKNGPFRQRHLDRERAAFTEILQAEFVAHLQ